MSVEAIAPKKRNLSFNGDDVRRMCTAIAGGLVLAIMTGPDGAISDPTYGVKTSLLTGHVVGYLVIGVVIGCLLTYRAKVRDGSWRRVRTTPKRTLIERATSFSAIGRGVLLAVTAVAVAIITLIFADFSGPVAANKMSIHEIVHQFLYTRTYGYLILALALWFVVVNQAMRSIPRPLFLLGAVITILLFALTSDPFLPARFSWRALNPGVDNSLFHHWTTYLWLIIGLAVAVSWMIKGDATRAPRPPRRSHALVVTPSMRFLTYVLAGFVVFEAPKFMSLYWQISLYQQIGVFCLLAIGLNIVVGFAGLLDLGYVAFYALGAYVTAYFSGALPLHPPFQLNPFFIIPFAIVFAMLSGVLLGLPTLRLRGDYLAIVTLGFGEIVYVLANDWTQVTAGSAGTGAITNFSVHLFGINYAWDPVNPLSYYYLLLGILIPAIFLFDLLNHSKVGRTWAAIREDEVAAQSLGINALKYKVMAFAMGASTAGVAGVFTAVKVGHLFPNTFILQLSISILVLVIFGGMGSIVGVLFGAIVLQWLPSYLNFHSYFGFQEADLYLYIGALLIVMMIFRPQGLVPSRRRRREILDSEEGLGSADSLGPITAEQPS